MVNAPGDYPLTVNMTVQDLILVAGNIRESAFLEQAEIIRSDIVAGKQVQTSLLTFDVKQALAGDPAHNIKLQPWDRIHIKQIPEWGESETITVSGELFFPGTYSIRKGERLSSLIERAGGFTEHSYFRGAVFTRESVRIEQQKHLDDIINRLSREVSQAATSQLAGAMNQADMEEQKVIMGAQQSLISRLKEVKAEGRVVIRLAPGPEFAQSNYNLALEAGDRLYIPHKPDTVSVAGEVYNPANLVFNQKKPEAKLYLALTGGPTKYANEKGMYILRADGTVLSKSGAGQSNVWLSSFEDTPLYPGDTLVIPPKLIHTRFKTELKDITSIIFELAVSAGIIINQVFD
jgi:protein involved in polysaccharide export with SLBB domain